MGMDMDFLTMIAFLGVIVMGVIASKHKKSNDNGNDDDSE
jgi:hypothetical protein